MFRPASGMRYAAFLRHLHRTHIFDWYMEIGCRTGTTLAEVRGKTIAVDPFFKVTADIIHTKPQLHIQQQTSDAFFESKFLEKMDIRLSFAFLDGMHLVEYLLRDVINTERNINPDGVIAMHDCVPFDFQMTSRNIGAANNQAWTGDVWKLIPILQKYRPDMTIDVVDCRPTGLVLLSNLSPGDTTLSDNYDQIIADWLDVTLEDYGAERFFDQFESKSAMSLYEDGFSMFAKVAVDASDEKLPEFVSP